MPEDIFDRIEALRASLAELEAHIGGLLRKSEEARRYEDFARAATDWVWEVDANLNYIFLSDGIASVIGLPARALEGQYLFSLNHFREVDAAILAVVDTIQARRPFRDAALDLVGTDGAKRRILISGVPAFDPATERFTGYRGIGVDVSARPAPPRPAAAPTRPAPAQVPLATRVAADEPREPDRRLARALDAGGIGVWEWDVGADTLYVAPGLATMLGYSEGSFDGTLEAWHGHVHPDDRRRVQAAFDDHLATRTPQIEIEHRMLDRSGNKRWVAFRARAERDGQGAPMRVVGACADVTERKRTEEALRAATEAAELASRAKSDFLANLSHELRTPLNAIIGFSEAIKDGYLGPLSVEKSREYASDVYEASTHLLELINDVLDMSKVEAGQVMLAEETVAVEDAIRAAVRMVEPRATAGGLTVAVEVPPDLPALRADPRLVRQSLLNLLTNAIKFTETGGRVTAAARRRDDGGITIEIADTGVGIAEEDIPKALEPFVQVGGDAEKRAAGTGLGLSLTGSLMELHGGVLELQSGVGEGTCAMLAFPPERSVA